MASVRKRIWKSPRGGGKAAWVVDYTDSRGARQRKHYPNKKAADAFRIQIEGQLRAGTYRPDAEKVTVKEACETFLDHCTERNERDERMTRKMLTVYKGHVANYILNAEFGLANTKLSQLTARVVNEFRDHLRGHHVTIPTTRKILATLHGVLAHAVSQDWVATNAAHGVKVIGPRDEGSKKIIPPTTEDLRAILNAADDDFRIVLQFAACTGSRAGEQWAARWRDVDVDGCKFHIRRRVDAYREEGAPKSAAGVRTVPISNKLATALKLWKLKSKFKSADDLIFPNDAGRHRSHDNLVKRQFLPLFERLAEDHKNDPSRVPAPPRRFNWHALRHYAVSSWIAAGCDPKTVQTFAGHASLQVTMDRYGHLFPRDDHKRAMDRIARDLFV